MKGMQCKLIFAYFKMGKREFSFQDLRKYFLLLINPTVEHKLKI
jgi:hypothetical protein